MKTAKRALAVMLAVLMVVSTCVIAASAATSLQAKIDAAAPGDVVLLDATADGVTTESVTVNKNITIDLNGQTLFGVMDKAAITVLGGNVTVTNGQVTTTYATNKPTEEVLKTVFDKCPPAILVRGGSLTVDGLRITGGQVRIPGSSPSNPELLLAGTGIMSYNGAPVTLKRTSIYGDYGVNNAVRENPAGGVVTIEDALIAAYTKAIKGQYVFASGTEEIVAADRIVGVLKDGITLTDGEKELVDNFFDERVIIATKTAEQLTKEIHALFEAGEDVQDVYKPIVNKIDKQDLVEIDAPILDWTWENTRGTDCSYRLVPERITTIGGGSALLDAATKNKVDETSKILYRVEFQIGDEAMPYIESLTEVGLNNPLDGAVGYFAELIDTKYKEYCGVNNNGYVDTYDELINELANLMETIDRVGNDEVPGSAELGEAVYFRDLDAYNSVRQALYRLAGKTAWNKYTGGSFGQSQWENIFKTTTAVPEFVGTLDRVQKLKDDMEAKVGGSFKNTAKYGDLAEWVINTAYDELLVTNDQKQSILDEAIERLTDLAVLLGVSDEESANVETDDAIAALIASAGIQDQIGLLSEGIENAQKIKGYLAKALGNGDVKATIDYAKAHSAEIKGYVEKAIRVANNWRDYVDPESFLVYNEDNQIQYASTYATYGPVEIKNLSAPNYVKFTTGGGGTMTVNGLTAVTTSNSATAIFRDSFKATATPDGDSEFLFWVARGGANYILSTEPTITVTTNVDKNIEAVFTPKDFPVVYFTNPNGDICGSTAVNGTTASLSDIAEPYISSNTFAGWPGADESASSVDLTAMDNEAYLSGNSAFAKPGQIYGQDGAILKVRPTSGSYIVTSKYTKPTGYTITFKDGDKTIIKNGDRENYVTVYSAYGAAYWKDEATGEVVCPVGAFDYQIRENATFVSVAGEYDKPIVSRVVNVGSKEYAVEFYSTKNVVEQGFVYSKTVAEPTKDDSSVMAINEVNPYTGALKTHGFFTIKGIPAGYNVRLYLKTADGAEYYGPVTTTA